MYIYVCVSNSPLSTPIVEAVPTPTYNIFMGNPVDPWLQGTGSASL